MKNFIIIFVTLLLSSCNAQQNNNPDLVYYLNAYRGDSLYAYKSYNSMNKEYHAFGNAPISKHDDKIKISLSKEEISQFYSLYKNLNLPEEKLCFIDISGKIESETIISFRNNVDLKKIKCLKSEKDKDKMLMITLKFLEYIKSKKEYRDAFPWEFEKM